MMLATYDRYMREFRAKQLAAKLERADSPGVSEESLVPGHTVVQLIRQAVKDSCRNMGGS